MSLWGNGWKFKPFRPRNKYFCIPCVANQCMIIIYQRITQHLLVNVK